MPPADSPVSDAADDFSALPLYNTSFTLYRCSPLHLPRKTTVEDFRTSLPSHTRRFADHLQREARLGLSVLGSFDDTDALVRAGPLKQTTWTWEESTSDSQSALEGPDGFGLTHGLRVVVEFERASYAALFLRRRSGSDDVTELLDDDASGDKEHPRLRLPLLFFRMPASLRGTLLSYIAAQFDARADPLHLSGPRLARTLEDYLNVIAPELQRTGGANDDDDSGSDADSRSSSVKDVQLTLSFPDPSLRSLDVAIPGKDVVEFLKLGAKTPKAASAAAAATTAGNAQQNGRATATNGTTKESEPKSQSDLDAGPFTRALSGYLSVNLALDTGHGDVKLARVACAGFAIAGEGRVKIFAPRGGAARDEAREVVRKLLEGIGEGKESDGDGDGDTVMRG